MKRMGMILLAVCLLASGCGKKQTEVPAASTAVPQTAPAAASHGNPAKTRENAYREVLENFAYEHTFPDGSAVPMDSAFGSMEGNYFALADVDGDGAEELVISFTAGPMAAMAFYVCGYSQDTGTVSIELTEFPAVTFYPGGYAEAQLSHNHGLAGDALWPYTLYVYTEGAYTPVAAADAWDRTLATRDSAGTPFPEDADADGDGIVFLVTENGKTRILDGQDYEDWRASLLKGAEPLVPDYLSVTRDNIREAFRE